MSENALERGLTGVQDVGTWTPEEARDYEAARDLINTLIAAYSARLATAPAGDDRQRLLAQQQECGQERRRLTVLDHEGIRRILDEYPGRIRQLRGAAR